MRKRVIKRELASTQITLTGAFAKRRAVIAAVAAAIAAPSFASAATANWDPSLTGTGGSDNSGSWDLTTTNWYTGSDVAWPNATGTTTIAVFGSGGTGTDTVTLNAAGIVTNGLTFNTGPTYTLAQTSGNTLTLGGTRPTITVNAASANISAGLTGSAGMYMTGTGMLTLSGANTYTGANNISSGTLQVNPGGTLGAATNSLYIGSSNGSSTSSTNVAINTNLTVANIYVNTQNSSDSLVIPSGTTVLDSGLFQAQLSAGDAAAVNLNLTTYNGSNTAGSGGELDVNGAMTVGYQINSGNSPTTATVDLSALSTFKLNSPTASLNIGASTQCQGALTLANNSNLLNFNAGYIGVTNAPGASGSFNAQKTQNGGLLNLGPNTNTIEATSLTIGGGKSNGVVQFNSTSGSVSILGTNGTGTTAITVGNMNIGSISSATAQTSGLYLAGHNATVMGGAVLVGLVADGAGAPVANATITFDTGTFNASSITLGAASAGGGLNASFVLGTSASSTGILNDSGAFVLGNNSGGSSTTPSLIINGGTANLNSGITTLSKSGTTNATLNLSGGILNVNGNGIGSSTAVGTTFTVNLPTSGQTATLMNLGGSGIYAGAGTGSTANAGGLVVGGSGTLVLAGSNNAYTGATTVNSGSTLQIGSGTLGGSLPSSTSFTNNGTVTFAGTVPISIATNMSGSGTVIHNSLAMTTLTGSNTYTGGTTINSGTLTVNGSLLSTGTVNVSGGTLAGIGQVGIINMTSGAIHPGASGADYNIGTLNTTGVTISGGDMRFDIGGSVGDNINDSGSAVFSGGTISLVLDSAPAAGVTSYTIFNAAGGISGVLPTLSTTLIGRTNFSLSNTSTSLIVNFVGTPANLIWGKLAGGVGDGTTWDPTQSNQNWNHGGTADTFYNDDLVTFNDNNGGFTSVNVVGTVTPGTVTFNNNTSNYTISGSGSIGGATGLTMNGTGTVTLQNANTYVGDTNINAGTFVLGTGGSVADTNFNINGGTVNVTGGNLNSSNLYLNSGSINVSSGSINSPTTIVNSGSVLLNGGTIAGTSLTINGGNLAVNSGTLSTTNVLVAGGANFTLASAGIIPPTTTLTLNGTGNLSGSATVGILNGSGTFNLNGNTLTAPAGGNFSGVIADGTGSGNLNVTGGTLALSGSNTYSGPTTISSGATLQLGAGGTTGSINPASTVAVGGTFSFNNSGIVNFTNTLTGTGSVLQHGVGTVYLSSNISGFTGLFNLNAGNFAFNYASGTTIGNNINNTGGATLFNVGKLTLSGIISDGSQLTFNVSSYPGLMPDGLNADVELTGSVNRTGANIVKTGAGILSLSGTADDNSLGVTVNGGTVLLNKASGAIHAIGGSGMVINSGGTVIITGTGGDQIYNGNGGGAIVINDAGTFELNGQSETINTLQLGSSFTTSNALLSDDVPNSTSTLTCNYQTSNGLVMKGNANLFAATGATLELTIDGTAPGGAQTGIVTTTGPGTVIFDGYTDNANMGLNVSSGTVILSKINSSGGTQAHAVNSIYLVNPGALVQLGSAGNGGDQIYNGYSGSVGVDWGVLNMNGTFDLNGMSEGFDKLTGTGNVINSQSSNSVLTLGTNNFIGPTTPQFAGIISGNITLNLNVSNGTNTPLLLTGSNTYTGGTNISNGLLQVGNGGSTGSIGSGPVMINTNMALILNRSDNGLVIPGAVSGGGNIYVTGSGTVTLGGTNTYTGQTNVQSGTLKLTGPNGLNGTALSISGGASVVATSQTVPSALVLSSLSNGGLIDLNNNGLDVVGGSLSDVTTQLTNGYNGGGWNGTSGIISTKAATNPTHLTTLGVIQNDNGSGSPLYGSGGTIAPTFDGVTPNDNDILVKYTYYGDANLSGTVDSADYARIDGGYLSGGTLTGWYNGDFNYDNVINGSDYTLIDNAFNQQGASLASQVASPTAQIAAVPEPASLGLLGLAVFGLLGRRKSRK